MIKKNTSPILLFELHKTFGIPDSSSDRKKNGCEHNRDRKKDLILKRDINIEVLKNLESLFCTEIHPFESSTGVTLSTYTKRGNYQVKTIQAYGLDTDK